MTDETFSLAEAKQLMDNLEKGIYEDALRYLTGSGEGERGLSLQTLKKFNVGLGSERFTNEDGVFQQFDSIYFPIYRPSSLYQNQSNSEANSNRDDTRINTDLAKLVKMKVRAAYPQHKSKQRVKPANS